MYFTMTTPDGETYYSKKLEGSTTEIGRSIGVLISKGGSFQLDTGEYILFSKEIAENSIFLLYPFNVPREF